MRAVLLTLTLLLATLLTAALLVSALVPSRAMVWLGSACNVVQLHALSLFGVYPSLALLCWLALWRSLLGSPLWRWPWMRALLGLAVIQAVSLAWSPSPLLGVRYLIYLLPLPFAAHAFYALSREQPQLARRCLAWLLFGSALEALLVIAFRLLPSVELAFLSRPLAGLFVSPNTLETLFGAERNNVLDPAKAGGFFVNGNIASTYLGVCAVAAWYVGKASGSKALRAVAVLDWTAVFLTGSKAGLVSALVVPVGLGLVRAMRLRRANPLTLFGAATALVALAVLLVSPFGREIVDDYRYATLATLGSREELWGYAVQMIGQHPLTGLGFGGWERLFEWQAFLTGSGVMPAHNSLFILWLQSGLFGVLAGVGWIVAVYAGVFRVLRVRDVETLELAMAALGAFSWYLLQGLGENFGLVGEAHMTPLIGGLLGHLCARHDGGAVRHERSAESLRGGLAPSAVPAV